MTLASRISDISRTFGEIEGILVSKILYSNESLNDYEYRIIGALVNLYQSANIKLDSVLESAYQNHLKGEKK